MSSHFLYFFIKSILMLALVWAPLARAGCSRPIQVPILPSGLTVMTKGTGYAGIVPEFLAHVSEKSACKFTYQLVPKSRQENLFEIGQADLLLTAVKTNRRDQSGIFVPLVQLRATLISIENGQTIINSSKDLLQKPAVKLLVVRGFDYGEVYQFLLDEMQRQGRLLVETDTISVARMMKANPSYVTIMAPTIFAGMLQTETKLSDLVGKVRYEKLDDFPWTDSGIYISTKSLNEADRNLLKTTMDKLAGSDTVWKAYQHYYSTEVVKLGLRPREPH